MRVILTLIFFWLANNALAADFNVDLDASWDGIDVPAGQQCTLFGGNGATPPFYVTDLPAGTAVIHIEFNDLSFAPLAKDGGHGIIGFAVSSSSVDLVSVPGLSAELPEGIFVVSAARSSGRYASDGYLPPCSGGRGNNYSADIIALDANGVELGSVTVAIGRY